MGCSGKITNVGCEFLTREFSHREPRCRNKFVQCVRKFMKEYDGAFSISRFAFRAPSDACLRNLFRTQKAGVQREQNRSNKTTLNSTEPHCVDRASPNSVPPWAEPAAPTQDSGCCISTKSAGSTFLALPPTASSPPTEPDHPHLHRHHTFTTPPNNTL
jgi:hypothetical protein